jgi:microcystin-dependent protein
VLDLPVRDFDTATRAFQNVELALVPAGAVVSFAGSTVPRGWLSLDGSTLLRANYPALSRVYPGSGASFVLPNVPGSIIKV